MKDKVGELTAKVESMTIVRRWSSGKREAAQKEAEGLGHWAKYKPTALDGSSSGSGKVIHKSKFGNEQLSTNNTQCRHPTG